MVLVQIRVKNVDHIRAPHLMPQRPLVCPGPTHLKASISSGRMKTRAKQGALLPRHLLGLDEETAGEDCGL